VEFEPEDASPKQPRGGCLSDPGSGVSTSHDDALNVRFQVPARAEVRGAASLGSLAVDAAAQVLAHRLPMLVLQNPLFGPSTSPPLLTAQFLQFGAFGGCTLPFACL
jgi:hypothetical protein